MDRVVGLDRDLGSVVEDLRHREVAHAVQRIGHVEVRVRERAVLEVEGARLDQLQVAVRQDGRVDRDLGEVQVLDGRVVDDRREPDPGGREREERDHHEPQQDPLQELTSRASLRAAPNGLGISGRPAPPTTRPAGAGPCGPVCATAVVRP